METKQCSQCKEIKELDQFGPHYNKKEGMRLAHCKRCDYALYKRPTQLKRLAKQGKTPAPRYTKEEIRQRHLERLRAYSSTEKGKAAKKRWKDKNKANKPVTAKAPKEPKIKSPEQLELERQKAKEYRRKYYVRTYVKKSYPKADPISKKVARNIRKRLKKQLDKGLTIGPTIAMLGCTIAEFRAHIETQFSSGMTWDNYGTVWHIDHIKPVCSFDLTIEGIAAQVNHYSNLRPLLAEDNLRKAQEDIKQKFVSDKIGKD